MKTLILTVVLVLMPIGWIVRGDSLDWSPGDSEWVDARPFVVPLWKLKIPDGHVITSVSLTVPDPTTGGTKTYTRDSSGTTIEWHPTAWSKAELFIQVERIIRLVLTEGQREFLQSLRKEQ